LVQCARAVSHDDSIDETQMALKDLTDVLAREYDIPASRARELILRYHALIEEMLANDGKVTLAHLGVLTLKHRKAREAVNPATGVRTSIPDRVRVGFRAAKDLVRRLNGEPS
jgi:nucleoid DNA-binding protein